LLSLVKDIGRQSNAGRISVPRIKTRGVRQCPSILQENFSKVTGKGATCNL
jgi:hypothetical protein